MACEQCGHILEAVDIPEPTESGSFVEHWQCPNCKASMYVSGQEDEPASQWDRWGSAYE